MFLLRFALLLCVLLVGSYAEQNSTEQPKILIKKEFVETDFALAFDVFVAAKNFNAAIEVAKSGIANSKESATWLLKAAKVSLWKSDAAGALAYYKELFKKTNSEEAAREIARIAPALNDTDGVIIAMQYALAKKTATKEEAAKLAGLYEEGADVQKGVSSMKNLYDATKNPAFLQVAAQMLQRAGDTDEALKTYRLIAQKHDLTLEATAAIASLLMQRGADEEAFALLKKAKGHEGRENLQFLAIYGELAWRLQEDKECEYAYAELLEIDKIKDFEFERLIVLKERDSKQEAAALAKKGYKKFGSEAMAIRALNLYSTVNDWASIKELLQDLEQNGPKKILQNPSFLTAKAGLYMHEKRYDKALEEYQKALFISKEKDAMELILLASIEKGDKGKIADYLGKFEPFLRTNPKYYGSLAAANATLSMQTKALAYYEAAYSKNKDNDQLLSDLVGAYEQIYYYSKAQNLREKLWEKALTAKELNASQSAAQSYMFGKLSSDTLLQNISKQLPKDDSNTLKYTYFSHIGGIDAAIKSMGQDKALAIALPAWIEMPIRNELMDFEAVDEILNSSGNIPPYDEMEANTWTRRFAQKEELAFEKMSRMDYDDESHRRFSERFFDTAQTVGGGFEYRRQPDMESLKSYLSTTLRPYRTLSIGAKIQKDKNRLHSQSVLKNDSYLDTKYSLELDKEWSGEAKTGVELTRRESLKDQFCTEATHDWVYSRDLVVNLSGGLNAVANETAAITIGGTRDFVAISATHKLSKREFIKLDQEFDSIKAQNGKNLSNASKTLLSLGYQARTEYPDINVRLYYGFNKYNSKSLGPSDFAEWESMVSPDFTATDLTMELLVPQSYGQYGIDISWGESISGENSYSKAFRPYGVLSLSANTRYGYGYGIVSGFVTSLEGKDRFQAYISYGQGGQGSFLANGANRGLGFSYLLGF